MGRTVHDALEQIAAHLVNISIPRFYRKYRRHVKVRTRWWTRHGTPTAFGVHIKKTLKGILDSYERQVIG